MILALLSRRAMIVAHLSLVPSISVSLRSCVAPRPFYEWMELMGVFQAWVLAAAPVFSSPGLPHNDGYQ